MYTLQIEMYPTRTMQIPGAEEMYPVDCRTMKMPGAEEMYPVDCRTMKMPGGNLSYSDMKITGGLVLSCPLV